MWLVRTEANTGCIWSNGAMYMSQRLATTLCLPADHQEQKYYDRQQK